MTPNQDANNVLNGPATITLTATDAHGASARDTFTVTVTAVNDAPVLGGASTTLNAINEDVAATSNNGTRCPTSSPTVVPGSSPTSTVRQRFRASR